MKLVVTFESGLSYTFSCVGYHYREDVACHEFFGIVGMNVTETRQFENVGNKPQWFPPSKIVEVREI